MPLLDTTAQTSSLDGRFMADLVLQILSYVAQKERESIRERQKQGIQAAKAKGKHLGRPPLQEPEGFAAVYQRWRNKEITAVDTMRMLNLKKTNFYKQVRLFEKKTI